ncbi:hypothetical protein BD780_003703 [Clostridium tetanomorphum]|uniref:AEC family transporter n=1 Tax=Clostridium tetanomorphum TaxID=1553 RepID=UPI0004527CB1|nr:AEC family transporter [Clostridium tetanomorphum]KAJ53083.1 permease [Clostridium tetanomorphum DSM 665]MBP1865532.1 auxin efflux carrier (AEC) [Clostridium tetanomorphum]NRS86478.1 hypothetical protein [Clostridium tetanomorphum]SQC00903.1 permease [Clostridium tetanomorphum]
MALLNAFGSIFSIVIMISLGYILTEKKWINESNANLFAKMVINLSLPTLMITNLMNNFDKAKLMSLGKGLFVPFTSIALAYIIGKFACKILKVRKGRSGTFQSMFFVSNTIFIGLPVNLAIFGERSIPYVLLYYIANTTFFWTIGVYEISKDGKDSNLDSIFSKATLKRIISPPLLGFIFAIVLILLEIPMPKFIMDTCKYLGNLTTPLSMLFIGNTIHSINLKNIKIDKDMIGVFIGRFIISPLLVVLIAYHFPLPKLMKDVFVVQAAMPVMTNTAIMSKAYDADYEYAAIMIALTTILSLIIIPIYKLILT